MQKLTSIQMTFVYMYFGHFSLVPLVPVKHRFYYELNVVLSIGVTKSLSNGLKSNLFEYLANIEVCYIYKIHTMYVTISSLLVDFLYCRWIVDLLLFIWPKKGIKKRFLKLIRCFMCIILFYDELSILILLHTGTYHITFCGVWFLLDCYLSFSMFLWVEKNKKEL